MQDDARSGGALTPTSLAANEPFEVAPRLWWVGHHQPGDPFQCHVYLLEHGRDSVLFDPGSKLTFRHSLRKIEAVVPFGHIRWFVCHHQDPDITGALPLIDEMVGRPDARVVTHWRAQALLRHLDLRLPFWEVDGHDWQLDLGGRVLQFVFTPYLHFPGAFGTLDRMSGTFLSSDLFGGFTDDDRLYAEGPEDFEGVARFHEHYMPSREILLHTLVRLRELPIRLIAPQHGRIIPEPLVDPLMDRMEQLECGLYLLSREDSDVRRLMQLNAVLRDTMRAAAIERQLGTVAQVFVSRLREVLPVRGVEFLVAGEDGEALSLGPRDRYRGVLLDAPEGHAGLLGTPRRDWELLHPGDHSWAPPRADGEPCHLVVPLWAPLDDGLASLAVLELEHPCQVTRALDHVLGQLAPTLAVALEREAILRRLELERDQLYHRAIRDALTGLYTRHYVEDAVERMIAVHDRDPGSTFAVVAFDVDHFKRVNDTYGHGVGDQVLSAIGRIVLESTRRADVPVRLGGEELSVYLHATGTRQATQLAERVRAAVAATAFPAGDGTLRVTMSAGVANHRPGESLAELNRRADAALYEAKRLGRDRVVVAEEPEG